MDRKLIVLSDLEIPDCEKCAEKTKKIIAKTFDVEGPGIVGNIYSCYKKSCRAKKNVIALYHLRSRNLI